MLISHPGLINRLAARQAALSVVIALCKPFGPGGVGTRTLGVDFGLRRCGLAVSAGFAPLPLRLLPCDDADAGRAFEDLARRVGSVASGEGARQIVVGMPFNAAGDEGEQANVTRTFVATLAEAVAPLPVFLWDERFSTAEARNRLSEGTASGDLDSVASTVILEDFFAAPPEVRAAAEHVLLSEAQQAAVAERAAAARSAAVSQPPPLSASEQRRRMMEEVEQQQKQQQQGALGRSSRRKKKR